MERFYRNWIKSNKAVISLGFNQVRIDGRPHHYSGLLPSQASETPAKNLTEQKRFFFQD